MNRCIFVVFAVLGLPFVSGCQGMLINATKPVMEEMIVKPAFESFLTEEDLDLARNAVGGQIKLAEIMMAQMSDRPELKLLLCRGFASFAQLLEPQRDEIKQAGNDASDKIAKQMTERIRTLALRGRRYCLMLLEERYKGFEAAALAGNDTFRELLAKTKKEDVRYLFWLGFAWGNALLNGLSEPMLVGQIPQLKMIMQRVVELESNHFYGSAHLFLATLYSQAKMYGGDPEKAKVHFDKVDEISQQKMLMAFYYKARFFTALNNDGAQCKALLKKVIDAPKNIAPYLMLINQLAKEQARVAMKSIDEFCP